MNFQHLPFDGTAFVLTTDTGAGLAFGAWEYDPVHLCAVVHDDWGRRALLTLLDADAELPLFALLLARTLARTCAAEPFADDIGPSEPGP